MPARKEEYVHEQLDPDIDQIRLLKLHPELDEAGTICFDIETFEIGQAPVYEALSYEWKSTRAPRDVKINGASLSVRKNLWQFLCIYRTEPWEAEYLWIDQICINQKDRRERSRQIQLMGRIFSGALGVLVWLGCTTNRKLLHIKLRIEATLANHSIVKYTGFDGRDCKNAACLLCPKRFGPIESNSQTTLHSFFNITYWRRVWMIQELYLARSKIVYLDHQRIDFSSLKTLLDLDKTRNRFFDDGCYNHICRILHPKDLSRHIVGAMDQIYDCRVELQCSDPHDLVYGLLGIASSADGLRVDYDLPTEEVLGDLLDLVVCQPDHLLTWPPPEIDMSRIYLSIVALAPRLGLPARWTTALGLDSRFKLHNRSPTNLNLFALHESLWAFTVCSQQLSKLKLDRSGLTIRDMLLVMSEARRLLELRRWKDGYTMFDWARDESALALKREQLARLVKVVHQSKAACREKGVPFTLPEIPLEDDLPDQVPK